MKKIYYLLPLIFTYLIFNTQCKKDDEIIVTDDNIINEDTIAIDDTLPPPPNPLAYTAQEKSFITSGDSADVFTIMNYYLQPDSVILRTPSINVLFDEISDSINKILVDRMYSTLRSTNGVGIAAPQIGINRRVIWVQRFDKGPIAPFEVYFNPIITLYSTEVLQRADGCLSVPTGPEWPNVNPVSFRATWVDVEYFLQDGSFVQERINHPYTSHIFQHEIDHLDGIMFMDRDQ